MALVPIVKTTTIKQPYRPVSNLAMSLQTAGEDHVASASQPLKVLLANNLCDNCQSVDRAHRGTETDLIDVMNCLPGRANEAQVSVLTLLDL